MTRECELQIGNQTSNATDAHGLIIRTGALAAFQDFLPRFSSESGLNVSYKPRTIGEYIKSWLEMWPTAEDPGPNDYWMVGGEVFGEDIKYGAFADLTWVLTRDPSYRFTEIPATFRDAGSSAFAGRYSALPLWLNAYTLLYRRDIFESVGISVPATWEEALAVAQRYGRGKLGPGMPQRAFCFESNPACGSAHALLMYIVGSMVQLEGPSHGTWFDPANLKPFYTGEAMREAMLLYAALKNHSVDDSTPCYAVYRMLASGECLMLWAWSFAFKTASHNSSSMRGRQGAAPPLGSVRVLDRASGRLVECTRQRCPYAVPANITDPATGARSTALVNSILPLDTFSFAINARAPLHRQAAAFTLLHEFTGPAEHMRAMLMPSTEFMPLRTAELDEEAWVAAGYDRSDVRDFLDSYREGFSYKNAYYELRMPGVFQIYTLVHNTVIRWLSGNATFAELSAAAAASTEVILAANGGRDYLLPLYRQSVGYVAPPSAAPRTRRSRSETVLLAALVPSLGCLVLLGAALWGRLRWSRARQERRARMSGAPGAGPGTTLLVTDIQDSTNLWEGLPAEVMDAAVKTHHRVIRNLLVPHHGYESATEGDSFILAFHKPERALGFALAAQEALLAADWPPGLSDSPHAAPLWVRRDAAAACALTACFSPSPALRDALAAAAEIASPTRAEKAGKAAGRQRRASCEYAVQPALLDQHDQQLLASEHAATLLSSAPPPSAPASGDLVLFRSAEHHQPYTHQRQLQQQQQQQHADTPFSPFCSAAAQSSPHASAVSSAGTTATLRQQPQLPQHQPEQVSPPPAGPASASALREPRRLALEAAMRGRSVKMAPHPTSAALRAPAATEETAGAVSAERRRYASSALSSADPSWQAPPLPVGASVCVPTTGSVAFPGEGPSAVSATAFGAGSTASSAAVAAEPTDSGALPVFGGLGQSGGAGGAGGGGGGGGGPACMTLAEVLARMFPELPSTQSYSGVRVAGGLLLYRGLRVRMGMHCGLASEAETQYNRASGRIVYPGPCLQLAKAVSDAGRGGQITLTAAVQRRVDPKWLAAGGGAGGCVVLSCGWHVVKEGEPAVHVVSAFPRALVARAGHMAPPRSVEVKVPGTLSAPLGRVVVALAQVQDPEEFAGWGLEVSMGSHLAVSRTAGRLACSHGGYLVTTAPGSVRAVFTRPGAALAWLLELQDELGPAAAEAAEADEAAAKQAAAAAGGTAHSQSSGSVDTREAVSLLRRAAAVARLSVLQLKGGVVAGPAHAVLGEGGELAYTGSAPKRAACLAAHAAWGEVLAAAEVVRGVSGQGHPAVTCLRGVSGKQRSSAAHSSVPRRSTLLQAQEPAAPSPLTSAPSAAAAEPRPHSGRLSLMGPEALPAAPASGELPKLTGTGPSSRLSAVVFAVAARARAATASGPTPALSAAGEEAPTSGPMQKLPPPQEQQPPPPVLVPTGVTICGRALLVGSEVRLVKFKGGAVEACIAKLGSGAPAAAAPISAAGAAFLMGSSAFASSSLVDGRISGCLVDGRLARLTLR